jgi:hypothetical protein
MSYPNKAFARLVVIRISLKLWAQAAVSFRSAAGFALTGTHSAGIIPATSPKSTVSDASATPSEVRPDSYRLGQHFIRLVLVSCNQNSLHWTNRDRSEADGFVKM